MNTKRAGKILLLSLIVSLYLLAFVGVVSAEEKVVEHQSLCKLWGMDTTAWYCKSLSSWERGINFDDKGEVDLAATTIKYFLLILMIILVYSALAYAEFPQGIVTRIILAVLAGFVSTFLISQQELLTALTSYTALAVSIMIFFPILVLGFFTLVIAAKGDPIGIFLQRIMWIIYSVYLFIKAGVLLLAKAVGGTTLPENKILKFFISDSEKFKAIAESTDNSMLLILVIVSIAVFVIMVVFDHAIVAWLGSEKRKAEVEGFKARLERSKNFVAETAKQMEKQKEE